MEAYMIVSWSYKRDCNIEREKLTMTNKSIFVQVLTGQRQGIPSKFLTIKNTKTLVG